MNIHILAHIASSKWIIQKSINKVHKTANTQKPSMDESFDSLFGFSCRTTFNDDDKQTIRIRKKRAIKKMAKAKMCINTHEPSKSLNSFNGSLDSLVSSSRLFFIHTAHQRYTIFLHILFYHPRRREKRNAEYWSRCWLYFAHTQRLLNLHQNDARCRSIIFGRRLLRLSAAATER